MTIRSPRTRATASRSAERASMRCGGAGCVAAAPNAAPANIAAANAAAANVAVAKAAASPKPASLGAWRTAGAFLNAGLSKQASPHGHRGTEDGGEHSEHGKEILARQEIQGAQHQAEFQESFADVEAQRAALFAAGFLVLRSRIALNLLGVAGVFEAGGFEFLRRDFDPGGVRAQAAQQRQRYFAGVLANLLGLIIGPGIVRFGSVNHRVGVRP